MGDPSPAQVHWFRLRRSGLVERFATPEETARRLVGVQAQLMPAAQVAFWNRTQGCSLERLELARLEQRSLVRFWGQRNTVHVYATEDWPFLHTALAERQTILSRKLEKAGVLGEYQKLVRRTGKRLAGRTLTYKDVRSERLQELADRWVVSYVVFMQLVREGVACHGQEQGSASSFVHREDWLPDLEWSPPAPEEALPELALRYLAAYGPARPQDLAFWYGTTLTSARRWLAAAAGQCRQFEGPDGTYWYRSADARSLAAKPPARSRWPVRLLYRFDPLLLATKDKSWLIDDEDYKKVWRAAAHVEPVVLAAGRIVGTWRYDRRARGLDVSVAPFAKLSRTVERGIEREARSLAEFLGSDLASLELGG